MSFERLTAERWTRKRPCHYYHKDHSTKLITKLSNDPIVILKTTAVTYTMAITQKAQTTVITHLLNASGLDGRQHSRWDWWQRRSPPVQSVWQTGAHTRTRTHTHTHTRIHGCTHTCTHTHTHTHARTHTCMHRHTHTHAHTDTSINMTSQDKKNFKRLTMLKLNICPNLQWAHRTGLMGHMRVDKGWDLQPHHHHQKPWTTKDNGTLTSIFVQQ